jgi:hypothetical protein
VDKNQLFDYIFKVIVENQDIRKQENLHLLSHLEADGMVDNAMTIVQYPFTEMLP